jgi:hypothetical protein
MKKIINNRAQSFYKKLLEISICIKLILIKNYPIVQEISWRNFIRRQVYCNV